MPKKYYALYAPYGIFAAYGPCHWPEVYVFETKQARDLWVWQDDKMQREPCTAADAHKYSQGEYHHV